MKPYTVTFSVTSTTPGFKFNGNPLRHLTTYIYNDVMLDEINPKQSAIDLFTGKGQYTTLTVVYYG